MKSRKFFGFAVQTVKGRKGPEGSFPFLPSHFPSLSVAKEAAFPPKKRGRKGRKKVARFQETGINSRMLNWIRRTEIKP